MTNRKVRPDVLAKTYIIAIAVFFFLKVLMIHIIDEDGTGVISTALEIYCIACSFFLWANEKNACSILRRSLIRNKYQQMMSVTKKLLGKALLTGVLIAIILLALLTTFPERVFDNSKAFLSIYPLALCIILMSVQGVLRAFVDVTGRRGCVQNAVIIHCAGAIFFAGGLATVFYDYGLKMNALLKMEDCAPAYGAFGAILGLLCVQVINLLYILIVYRLRYQLFRKKIRNFISTADIKVSSSEGFAALAALFMLFGMMMLVNEKTYLIFAKMRTEIADISGNWGILYGAGLPAVFIFGIICALPFVREYYVLSSEIIHSDYQTADDHFDILVRRQAVISVPVTVFTAVMARQLDTAFAGTPNDNAVNMMICASPIVILSSYAIVLSCSMVRMKRYKAIATNVCLTVIADIVVLMLLIIPAGLGLHAVIGAIEAMLIVYDFLNISEIGGMFHHRLELSRQFLFTVICAGITGLILFF